MKTTLRQLIDRSGKRTVVTYKGKDKRTKYDDSVTNKKMQIINNLIGGNTEEIAKILSK
jgi:hypothetical protein